MKIILKGLLFVSFLGYVKGDCHLEFYGTDCEFRCHCRRDGNCDPSSGECGTIGCAGGWMGPSCQYENIAYNKQTSSEFYNHQYAVDGREDTYAYTWLSKNTQMSINLGESFTVERLLVHRRSDTLLGNFLVYVGSSQDYNTNSLCYNYTGNGNFADITCEEKLNGTYLQLVFVFTGTVRRARLNEVEVYRGPCPRGTFGNLCNFKCRCESDDHCNQLTGECSDQCKPGWMGPSCQYGNIAYGSSQSGTLYSGDRIIDGSRSSCTYGSNTDDSHASINLGGSYIVRRLLIHGDVGGNPLGNFLVYVGSQSDFTSNNLCYNYTQNEILKTVDVKCERELEGMYIHVLFPGTNRQVNLCEVEVYGGQDVAYRKQTDQFTNWEEKFGSGRAVDGNSGVVFDGDSCTHTHTVDNPWWKVELNGTFVISWMKIFNRDTNKNRLDGFKVDITYSGQRDTVYTDNVPGDPPDETRFPVTPHRVGEIVTVWIPRRIILTLCEVEVYAECMNGTFGIGCLDTCNCEDSTEVCDVIDGGCAGGCKKGYMGDGCQFACRSGTFGFGCRETCPHCVNGSCHHVDGKCTTRCEIGYRGFSCNDECVTGTFGEACSKQCGQCKNDECHHKNGSCLSGCEIGYIGDRCKEQCSSGKYGMHCDFNCSSNCVDTLCNYASGHCLSGCIGGYHGDNCTLAVVSPDSDDTVAIIGAVAGAALAVIIIIVVIVIIICRRKRKRKQSNTDTQKQVAFSSIDSEDTRKKKKQDSIKTGMDKDQENESCYETVALDNMVNTKTNGTMEELDTNNKSYPSVKNVEKSEKLDENYDNYYNFGNIKKSETAIKIEDLWGYVHSRQSDAESFKTEFSKFASGMVKPYNAAKANMDKNRYKGLYAYDHSRVKLVPEDNDEGDYMNANYIDGYERSHAYIASQGTTQVNIVDFWRMIWQQKCNAVVMLTNLVEVGGHKCVQYWPDKGEKSTFGKLTVTLQKEEPFSDFIIRYLRASQGNASRVIRQYHFTAWPDKDVPSYASSLIHFHRKVKSIIVKSSYPTVVHCSAGVGRTGTFIALDCLIDEGEKEECVDIFKCVERLREQRVNMIQTVSQYIFLHTAVVEALNCRSNEMSCADFREFYKKICEEESRSGTSNTLESELSKLEYVYADDVTTYKAGKLKQNSARNRVQNILPADSERVLLSTRNEEENSYINAVYLPGLRKKDQFILTQTPLTNTTVDFWHMVYDQQTRTLVDLSTDPTVDIFYPTKGEMKFGPFSVTCESSIELDDCQTTVYSLTLSYSQILDLKLYRPHFWAGESMPSPSIMLRFLNEAGQLTETSTRGHTVVICRDGAIKSGLFCVACVSLDRLKVEQEVAVGQIIKQFRRTRPQIIRNKDQLKLCYDVLSTYLDENETYSNFS